MDTEHCIVVFRIVWAALFCSPRTLTNVRQPLLPTMDKQCADIAGIARWLECWTCDQKIASSNPGRSSRRIYFSRVNFVCWLLFCIHFTPVLPQWHVKDSGHSAKSAGGRLHLNTHTPLTQWSWGGLTKPLSRHSVGTCLETVHTQLVREHSATVVSAGWATVDWSWLKEWN